MSAPFWRGVGRLMSFGKPMTPQPTETALETAIASLEAAEGNVAVVIARHVEETRMAPTDRS